TVTTRVAPSTDSFTSWPPTPNPVREPASAAVAKQAVKGLADRETRENTRSIVSLLLAVRVTPRYRSCAFTEAQVIGSTRATVPTRHAIEGSVRGGSALRPRLGRAVRCLPRPATSRR